MQRKMMSQNMSTPSTPLVFDHAKRLIMIDSELAICLSYDDSSMIYQYMYDL